MSAAEVATDAALCECGIDVSGLQLPGLAGLSACPEGCVDGSALMTLLSSLRPADLLTDMQVLDLATAWSRLDSFVQANHLRSVAEFARRPEQLGAGDPLVVRARRRPLGEVGRWSPEAELGPALGLSPADAGWLLATACQAVGRFAAALRALHCGRIDLARLNALVNETAGCSDEVAATVTADLLAEGGLDSLARFRRQARRAVLRHDPDGAAQRTAERRRDVFARTRGASGDTAWVEAHLPAEDAQAVRAVLDAAARSMKEAEGEDRSTDQLRAAALVAPFWAALASGELTTPQGPLPLASIAGQSPALTLVQHADGISELQGYGPVSTLTADAITARVASGCRPVVRIKQGCTADDARRAAHWPVEDSYRPSAALARLVRDRDQTCRYPGCSAAAARADLDHTTPWPEGPTHPDNLAVLCRRHHRTKQAPGYSVRRDDAGRLLWKTPSGHVHTTGPPDFPF
jgi:hypothetical protein